MTEEEIAVVGAMVQYGGSFVQALGRACQLADAQNLQRIRAAFPDIWAQYARLVQIHALRAK